MFNLQAWKKNLAKVNSELREKKKKAWGALGRDSDKTTGRYGVPRSNENKGKRLLRAVGIQWLRWSKWACGRKCREVVSPSLGRGECPNLFPPVFSCLLASPMGQTQLTLKIKVAQELQISPSRVGHTEGTREPVQRLQWTISSQCSAPHAWNHAMTFRGPACLQACFLSCSVSIVWQESSF